VAVMKTTLWTLVAWLGRAAWLLSLEALKGSMATWWHGMHHEVPLEQMSKTWRVLLKAPEAVFMRLSQDDCLRPVMVY
jgi:hypothetical protein